jgi:hypothetical protein
MYSMTLRCAGGRTLSTYVTRSSPSKAASRSSSKPSWYGIWPRSMRRRTTRGGSTRLVLDEIVNHGLARVGKRVFGHRPAPEHLLQGFCSRVLTFFPLRPCEHRDPHQFPERVAEELLKPVGRERPGLRPGLVWLYQRGALPSVRARFLHRSCHVPKSGNPPEREDVSRNFARFSPGLSGGRLPLEDEE